MCVQFRDHNKSIDCERARSELFFEKGLSPQKAENEFFVVKTINCDFKKSAVLGDMLEVKTGVIKRKNSSLILQQDIYRGEELIFTAEIVVVYVIDAKPSRIPEDLFEVINND